MRDTASFDRDTESAVQPAQEGLHPNRYLLQQVFSLRRSQGVPLTWREGCTYE